LLYTIAIVLSFLGLLVVIMVHEFGHYLVARAFGFKVEEYFVGFGPKIWSFRRGEIEYGVKAFPVGGYVKIAGMDPFHPPAEEDLPRSYGAKPRWQRALTIVAGPATHFLVGVVLFTLAFMFVGRDTATPIVGQVVATVSGQTSPASEAHLEPGDRIVRVGPIANPTRDQLLTYTRTHIGAPVPFVILRDGRTFDATMTPIADKTTIPGQTIGRIGILLGPEKFGPVAAFTRGVHEVGTAVANTATQIGHIFGPQGIGRVIKLLFTNAPRQGSDVTTVVGVGRVVGETAQQTGLGIVLWALGYLTVFVGLLNLLPLPPFDGGHLAVLAIEKLRGGKTIDMKKLIPVSAAVIALLGTFVFMVLLLDIFKPLPSP